MSDTKGEFGADAEATTGSLSAWRQGDYTLSILEFISAERLSDGMLEADAHPVKGLIVVTQTCDIVNSGPGKDHVIVCPLVEVTDATLQDVQKGRTPVAAIIEHPPERNVVADLGRMMSLSKSVLSGLERKEGFITEEARSKFAEALQRKHGRFAFPDEFNDAVLSKLRGRLLNAHGKPESDHGKAYRSIQTVRVTAHPNWEGRGASVFFHFVLEPEERREVNRQQIAKTLDEHLGKVSWPKDFSPLDPPYALVTLEEMTAAEWTKSQPIDWDFISVAGAPVATDLEAENKNARADTSTVAGVSAIKQD